ncbi:hypothetical protein TM233_60130 [Bradyrhizobium sp. TM233]|nr:hypothetical protein TM233_60130 [Bradyrhizobium sp. TM233]
MGLLPMICDRIIHPISVPIVGATGAGGVQVTGLFASADTRPGQGCGPPRQAHFLMIAIRPLGGSKFGSETYGKERERDGGRRQAGIERDQGRGCGRAD